MVILHSILSIWIELLWWLIGLAILFTTLSKLFPCNPDQSLLRKDIFTDLFYYFFSPILNRFASVIYIGAGVFFIFHGKSPENIMSYMREGFGPLAKLPIWLQSAMMFLLSDFLLYWLHRWFHEKAMWKFHAVHHSSEHVDWLSTYRFHPINTWLSFTLVDSTMMLIGFSPACVAALASFNILYSGMVHANLNWTFGPFKYLFASPVFHRWHHTAQEEGMNKNFAPTIPLLDVVFGTFYMPQGRRPERYGAPGSNVPDGFATQLAYPFIEKK